MSANFKTVWWFFTSLGKPKFDIISFLPEHFTWGLMPYLSTVYKDLLVRPLKIIAVYWRGHLTQRFIETQNVSFFVKSHSLVNLWLLQSTCWRRHFIPSWNWHRHWCQKLPIVIAIRLRTHPTTLINSTNDIDRFLSHPMAEPVKPNTGSFLFYYLILVLLPSFSTLQ